MHRKPGPRRTFRLFLCLLGLGCLTVSGCRSYQLGHPTELPFETIFVQPADNESFAPQAQAILSTKIREAMLRDSRVTLLADPGKADVLLSVTLTEYERRGATRDPDDTEVALDFDLVLTAQTSLFDQRKGRFIFENRQLEAQSSAFVNNLYAPAGAADTQSFTQSEYQAMPRIARDLATQITNEVLGAW